MSTKPVMTPVSTVVCDLCGEAIDTYSNRDRAALNWGTTPLPEYASARPRWLIFFRRPNVRRGSGAPEGDNRSWQWDFHGECLVRTLEPIINKHEGEGDAH